MSAADVTTLVHRPASASAIGTYHRTVEDIVEQKRVIQECIAKAMTEGEHYGIIPGTSRKDKDGKELAKPSLLKPGAETLGFLFRLKPSFTILSSVETQEFIKYKIKCTLSHIETDKAWGEGLASCNSREAKYMRPAPKKCPKCEQPTLILNDKYERDQSLLGGMFCYPKKGGCGAKYKPGDEAIEKQPTGIADPSDLDNTILKMACKRAHVAATLAATAASDFFTQDLEDLEQKAAEYIPPPPAEEPPKKSPGALQRPRGPSRGAKGQTADATPVPAEQPPAPEVASPLYRDLEASVNVDVVDHKTGEVKRHPRVTAEQIKKIHVLRAYCRIDDNDWKGRLQAKYSVTTSKDLAKFQASDLIERLQKMADRARQAAEEIAPELADDKGDEPTPEEMRGDPKRDPEER